ncbi:hypothetical protein Tco_0798007 [Tanacetum coccineum]
MSSSSSRHHHHQRHQHHNPLTSTTTSNHTTNHRDHLHHSRDSQHHHHHHVVVIIIRTVTTTATPPKGQGSIKGASAGQPQGMCLLACNHLQGAFVADTKASIKGALVGCVASQRAFGFGVNTKRGSFGQGGGDFPEEKATGNTNIKQCLRKVADGHFTAAVKVLSSSGVAPYCDDTINALEAKHPYKPPPSMPSITFSEPPLVAEIDSVFSCIKSFPKGTSCGRDGLRAQHILDALCGEGSATATDLLKIKDSCKLLLHAWYLDDRTVIGDSEEVAKVLDIIKVSGPGRPAGVKPFLEGAVSRDADFISGLAMRRAANAVDLMSLLPQLHDPQSELLLLRSCMGIAKLFFGLRTCQPVHMEEATLFFEKDFLLAIPIDRLGQHMSPVEYRTILKYHLIIPLFPVDAVCPVCRKACLDSFGRVGISAKKEAPVNFLTNPSDGRSTLRPTDVLVFGWVGGKHACVDLTGVSPLVVLSSRGFTAGQAALKAVSGKVTKHEKVCIENQHLFIPFVFDTFGFLAPEAVELLGRVQRVVHDSHVIHLYHNVVLTIGCNSKRASDAACCLCLPFTTM